MLLVEYTTSIIAGYPRPKSHDPRAKRPQKYGAQRRPTTAVTRQPKSQSASGLQRPTSCGGRLQRSATSVSIVSPSLSSCALTRDGSPSSQAYYRPASSMTYPQTSRPCLTRQRKMTRSAPPARTTSPAKRTSGTHARNTKSRDAHSAISLGDIYQSAERERINYSTACRRQNLAHAQSQTQFFRQDQGSSRPNTSRTLSSFRPDLNTPLTAWSEPNMSRPGSILPNAELQALVDDDEEEDYDDGEFDMTHHTHTTSAVSFSSPVSRDCCEIIGPQMCYECRKNRIRQVNKERSDMFFPLLQPVEENLTTAAIVRKYLPGLSDPEIEDKIARGEIARPSLRRQNKHVEFDDEETETKHKPHNKKVTIVERESDKCKQLMQKKPSELFFTNIRDLNTKIITGTVGRNVGFTKSDGSGPVKKAVHHSKNMYPAFVSPRKVTLMQETNYKTFFTPPLIEKAKQDVEPAFFAGSKDTYKLPDKLPDELVFVDKQGKEVKASDSKGFTSKSPAASEGKVTESNADKAKVKEEAAPPPTQELFSLAEDEEEEGRESEESEETEKDSQQDFANNLEHSETSECTVESNVQIIIESPRDSDDQQSSEMSN